MRWVLSISESLIFVNLLKYNRVLSIRPDAIKEGF